MQSSLSLRSNLCCLKSFNVILWRENVWGERGLQKQIKLCKRTNRCAVDLSKRWKALRIENCKRAVQRVKTFEVRVRVYTCGVTLQLREWENAGLSATTMDRWTCTSSQHARMNKSISETYGKKRSTPWDQNHNCVWQSITYLKMASLTPWYADVVLTCRQTTDVMKEHMIWWSDGVCLRSSSRMWFDLTNHWLALTIVCKKKGKTRLEPWAFRSQQARKPKWYQSHTWRWLFECGS